MKDRLSGAPKIVTCASPISRPLTLFTALRGEGGKRSPVSNLPAHDIGRLALQGGTAKFAGQALNFLLRLLYIVTVARLLTPADFGRAHYIPTVALPQIIVEPPLARRSSENEKQLRGRPFRCASEVIIS